MQRHLTTDMETLVCGVQSYFTTLSHNSDLSAELNKTLQT